MNGGAGFSLVLSDDQPVPLGVLPDDPSALPGRLLARLLHGAAMTSNDWLRAVGSSRLAASVHRLRAGGWLVIGERVEVPTSDADRWANVARYSLDPAQRAIAMAQPKVATFVAEVREAERERRAA